MAHFRAKLGLLAAMLAIHATPCPAAFTLPAALEQATEAEKLQYLQTQGEYSLRDKLAAGKERFEQRQAFRQALVEGMKTTLVQRRQVLAPPPPSLPSNPLGDPRTLGLTLTVIALAGCLAGWKIRAWKAEGINLRWLWTEQLNDPTWATHARKPVVAENPETATPVVVREAEAIPEPVEQPTDPAVLAKRFFSLAPMRSKNERLNNLAEVRVCLNLSEEVRRIAPEERVRSRITMVLRNGEIDVREKADIWLELTLAGTWNKAGDTFSYQQELVLLDGSQPAGAGADGDAPPVASLWAAEYSGFSTAAEVEDMILGAVEQLTGTITA